MIIQDVCTRACVCVRDRRRYGTDDYESMDEGASLFNSAARGDYALN